MRFSSGLAIAPRFQRVHGLERPCIAGSIRSRKPSSNRIRLTSSVRPRAGTRQRCCRWRFQRSDAVIVIHPFSVLAAGLVVPWLGHFPTAASPRRHAHDTGLDAVGLEVFVGSITSTLMAI